MTDVNAGTIGLSELVALLTEGFGKDCKVVSVGGYAAILHPGLGLAAVVPSDDETAAATAAVDLTSIADEAGVTYPAMHFAVSFHSVKPPWVVRGAHLCIDIVSAMARASVSRPPFGQEEVAKLEKALTDHIARKAPEPPPLDIGFLRMIEACVERALAGRPAWVAGVEVSPQDIAGARFLLPALLIAAAENWALPVVASKGKGGFLIRLSADPGAILGYRVSSVDMSAPLLLFLPVVNLVRRSFAKGECSFDETVNTFARFLKKNGLEAGVMEDVDVRVATST